MNTITREQLHERARRKVKELEFAITQSAFTSIRDGLEEELKLAEIALASLDAEPVAYIFKHPAGELFWALTDKSNKGQNDVIPVYAVPPASVTGIYDDVLNIIGLLENNEWAEHCTSTVLGSLLESEITRLVSKEQPAPVVPFYRDGIEAAASWVDKQRQAFDNEHGRYDSDTGAFEFGNDAQRDYSDTLAELADGIRGLHPNAGDNSPVTPDCWIPVSERMPGSQEWVIVFAKWANQQVLCWDDVQNRWTDFEDESYYADMFTHWMPLPEPPQQ
ncbi:TPA_asm: DUF551 domain-containing protein [Salmonella enterica subsp. enterica serovar Madelia]|nr:DUF551 domain-containing protein [Salmonella enterica subsp. enterica serovar Madelia]HAE6912404.1 DUF551 domain-containing protein [Salmonella enterica subsp. enterica serovar Madelia]